MAFYLKWPNDGGSEAANNQLCQLSGIATSGTVTVALEFAEDMTSHFISGRRAYIIDGRRSLDTDTTGDGGGYIFSDNNGLTQILYSNFKLNGANSTVSQISNCVAGDVFSFDYTAGSGDTNGIVAIGARFNRIAAWWGLALRKITITDINGTHIVDMSSSGGTASTFTSLDGVITLKLFGFTSGHWVWDGSSLQNIYLNVVGAGGKYVSCGIPQPAIDTGRALQVEYEDEFEVRRTATDWPLVSTSYISATDLIFLKTGSDVEIRSTGNSNWIVTTGVDLAQFHVFKYRTTFDGTTITRQLYVDGVLKGTTTALSNSRMGAMTGFFGLTSDASRSGDFKYFKRTDFVNPSNSREYNAGASGGTGNIIPELLYSLHGVQQGTWPADNSEWVPYGSVGGSGGVLKYWNGSAWATGTLKYWNGSAWVAKPLKYYNGSTWV